MKNLTKSIEINKRQLSELLETANHGSTDRDICYNTETGEIADLHNTCQHEPWVILIDLYNTTYDGVDTWTVEDWENLLTETETSNCDFFDYVDTESDIILVN